jgi:hypothetical protein
MMRHVTVGLVILGLLGCSSSRNDYPQPVITKPTDAKAEPRAITTATGEDTEIMRESMLATLLKRNTILRAEAELPSQNPLIFQEGRILESESEARDGVYCIIKTKQTLQLYRGDKIRFAFDKSSGAAEDDRRRGFQKTIFRFNVLGSTKESQFSCLYRGSLMVFDVRLIDLDIVFGKWMKVQVLL